MKRLTHTSLRVLSLVLLMLSAGVAARAQDPVGPKHSHPNYYVFVISDAVRQFTDANPGDTTDCTGSAKTVKLTAGQEISKPPVTHCEANVGTTDTHLIVVEIKPQTKKTATAPTRKPRRR